MNKNLYENIVNRKYNQPSFVPTEEDIQSVITGKIRFYSEDLKKMEQMSSAEAREYSADLVMKNRFIAD